MLFYLRLSDYDDYPADLDLFEKDRKMLENDIRTGLGMCAHCKFYEKT